MQVVRPPVLKDPCVILESLDLDIILEAWEKKDTDNMSFIPVLEDLFSTNSVIVKHYLCKAHRN